MERDDPALASHRRRPLAFRYVRARPRLFGGLALGLLTSLVLPHGWSPATRGLLSWNVGVTAFLVSVIVMMARDSHQMIRKRAALHDEGQHLILALASLAAAASIVAIIFQLAAVAQVKGSLKLLHLGLAGLTIFTSWCFVHVMFALHYAHEFYDPLRASDEKARSTPAVLDIPGGDEHPDYFDFMYFSFVIGVASATADINIASRRMRRVALVHCILSFFFNIAVLGLSINIASGVI
jgi:uncharacterized membrane protein